MRGTLFPLRQAFLTHSQNVDTQTSQITAVENLRTFDAFEFSFSSSGVVTSDDYWFIDAQSSLYQSSIVLAGITCPTNTSCITNYGERSVQETGIKFLLCNIVVVDLFLQVCSMIVEKLFKVVYV